MIGKKYLDRIRNLGLGNFLAYTYHQKTKLPNSGEFALKSKYSKHPLICRGGTSDLDVFKHIFVLREYASLHQFKEPQLIIDCGANAGYSGAYFLSNFPTAHLVAVEPDPENYSALQQNLAPFGDRYEAIMAGIWPRGCGLKITDADFGDGREWARCVREAEQNEAPDVMAVSIPDILDRAGTERVSILKIDIEGAERELFSAADLSWLEHVDTITIELHGDDCERIYFDAVQRAGFRSYDAGGITISKRD